MPARLVLSAPENLVFKTTCPLSSSSPPALPSRRALTPAPAAATTRSHAHAPRSSTSSSFPLSLALSPIASSTPSTSHSVSQPLRRGKWQPICHYLAPKHSPQFGIAMAPSGRSLNQTADAHLERRRPSPVLNRARQHRQRRALPSQQSLRPAVLLHQWPGLPSPHPDAPLHPCPDSRLQLSRRDSTSAIAFANQIRPWHPCPHPSSPATQAAPTNTDYGCR